LARHVDRTAWRPDPRAWIAYNDVCVQTPTSPVTDRSHAPPPAGWRMRFREDGCPSARRSDSFGGSYPPTPPDPDKNQSLLRMRKNLDRDICARWPGTGLYSGTLIAQKRRKNGAFLRIRGKWSASDRETGC
jgi:hypothetical protein